MPRHPVAGVEEPAARGQFSSRPGGPRPIPAWGSPGAVGSSLPCSPWPNCSPVARPPLAAPPGDGPAPLEFVPCEGMDCATLVVLVNHTDPEGATTELPVLRHRATDPARRLGVLLVNPGGPGAPAGDQVRRRGSDRSRAGDPAGLADPLHPWARAMTDSLHDAVLLTVDGIGHGAHGSSGECMDGAVDTYLFTGRTPRRARPAPSSHPRPQRSHRHHRHDRDATSVCAARSVSPARGCAAGVPGCCGGREPSRRSMSGISGRTGW